MSLSLSTARANKLAGLNNVASIVYPKQHASVPTELDLKLAVNATMTTYPAFGRLIKRIAKELPALDIEKKGETKSPMELTRTSGDISRSSDTPSTTEPTSAFYLPDHDSADIEMDLGDFCLDDLSFPDENVYVPRAPLNPDTPSSTVSLLRTRSEDDFFHELDHENNLIATKDLTDIHLSLPLSERFEPVSPWGIDVRVEPNVVNALPPTQLGPEGPFRALTCRASAGTLSSILKRPRNNKLVIQTPIDSASDSRDLSTWMFPLASLAMLVGGPAGYIFTLAWIYLASLSSVSQSHVNAMPKSRKTVRFTDEPTVVVFSDVQDSLPAQTSNESSDPVVILAPIDDVHEREGIVYTGPATIPASLSGQAKHSGTASGRRRRNAVGQDSRADIESIVSHLAYVSKPSPSLTPAPSRFLRTSPPCGVGRKGSNMGEWLQQLATSQGLHLEVPWAERQKLAEVLNTPPSSPDSTPPSTPTFASTPFSPLMNGDNINCSTVTETPHTRSGHSTF